MSRSASNYSPNYKKYTPRLQGHLVPTAETQDSKSVHTLPAYRPETLALRI